jgi:hypothetical protein
MKSLNQNLNIMKKINSYLLTLFVALIVVVSFTSCNKDEAGVFNPDKKISKIYFKDDGGQEYISQEWTWDGKTLTSITYYDEGVSAGSETFEYTDGKLSKVLDSYGYYSLYTYDDKHYAKVEYYNDLGELLSDLTFQYTEDKVTQMTLTTYVETKHVLTMINRGLTGKMFPASVATQMVKAIKENVVNNTKSATNIALVYDGDNISSMSVGSYMTTLANYDEFKNPYYGFYPFSTYNEETVMESFPMNNPGTMTTTVSSIDVVTTFTYTYDGDYPTNIISTASMMGVETVTNTRILYLD